VNYENFTYTSCPNYYSFNVNCTSFNKIYSLVFEIWQFKNYQFESQIASTGKSVTVCKIVLAAANRVIVPFPMIKFL